jgi:hypothetical protein
MCLVGSIDMVIESWLESAGEPTGPSLAEMMDQAARFFVPALLAAEAPQQGPEDAPRAAAPRRTRT